MKKNVWCSEMKISALIYMFISWEILYTVSIFNFKMIPRDLKPSHTSVHNTHTSNAPTKTLSTIHTKQPSFLLALDFQRSVGSAKLWNVWDHTSLETVKPASFEVYTYKAIKLKWTGEVRKRSREKAGERKLERKRVREIVRERKKEGEKNGK